MKYFRERVLEPILIPLAALGVIAFGAVNLSRLFLASAPSDRAVPVATLVAVLILTGAAVATRAEKIDRGVLLGAAVILGAGLSIAGLVAEQVDLDHLAAEPGHDGGGGAFDSEVDIVAIDFDFPQEAVEAAGPAVKVNLDNQGAAFHTFVVEGLEDSTKVEATAGSTGTETIELEPGDFVFYCDVPGHREAGMEATLSVVEGGGELGGGDPGAGAVKVPAQDITFPVTAFEASAGEIAFEYDNQGDAFHTLVVEGHEADMRIETGGGEKGTGKLVLPAGTYTLYCDVPGHRAAGMEGTLTVT